MEETKHFYESLYDKREVEAVNLDDSILNPNKLTDIKRDQLEGLLTYKEAHAAFKQMKNNKSPGSDGFTTEFLKFFFIDIGQFLVRSINFGFEHGCLSVTQRQGVITCIPKEGKDKRFLKNWRPISLLNISYKIASAAIANRLKQFLHKLIHNDQKGFMQGKYLGENLRMIYDLIEYTEKEQLPGLLLLVDFEKAFDSISWVFISNVLDYLNFGPMFQKWIDVFYSQCCSCLSVNGSYSNWFNIFRGVRQGDPLSPYLYLICAEILSTMLRESEQVKGINVNNFEFLLSQFADDTAICLDGSEESFRKTIEILSTFAKISGLKINFEKTVVTWIGSRKGCNVRYLRDKNFCWDPGIFKYLGIKFSLDLNTIPNINYSDKLDNIRKLLLVWKKRHLTPFGKITVLKTLALSQITHLFITLPDPSDMFLNQLDKMFFNFLWDGKPSKIHKKIVTKMYENGGIKMINVYDFLSNMKLSWIRRLYQCNTPFQEGTFALFPCLKNLDKVGSEKCTQILDNISNHFWVDVIKHFLKLDKILTPTTQDEFNAEFIFLNKKILVGNAPIIYNDWLNNNVYKVHHLLDDQGNYLSFAEFTQQNQLIQTNFIQYHGVIRAIQFYQNKLRIQQGSPFKIQSQLLFKCIFDRKLNSIREHQDFFAVSLAKWDLIFENIEWSKVFEKCFKTTTECKLKWLQYRIIYRAIPTNRYLFIRRLIDDSICEMCGRVEEDLIHMFCSCIYVKDFWENLKNLLKNNCDHIINLEFSEELIIFGTKKYMYTDIVFDLILLCAKQYIYSLKWSKCKPNITVFHRIIKNRYLLEKNIAYSKNKEIQFRNDWTPYNRLIEM